MANSDFSINKWHIYDAEHKPLCWHTKALEFDFDTDASEFLDSVINHAENDKEFYNEVEIVLDTLYYVGGYLNATNLRIGNTGELIDIS